jgi:hypothetical protein
MRLASGLCVILLLLPGVGRAQSVAAPDAMEYVGQTATVCGVVASARYSARTKARPTFLNLDQPYPRQVFTVVIFGDERPKFGQPEITFKDKRKCATGQIEMYRGKPEMILNDQAMLRPDDGRDAAAPSKLTPALTE